MELTLPFRIEYKTEDPVPIPEIVDSLLSLQMLLEEAANNFEIFIPGLIVEKTEIRVKEISHGSLKEILLLGIFATFQDQLNTDIPILIKEFTGVEMPEHTHTLLTILVLIAIVYGADYIKTLVAEGIKESLTSDWKRNLIEDLAKETGSSYEEVKKKLDDRYGKKNRLKKLADSSVKFFRPSKNQDNAPIDIGDQRIEPKLIADSEPDYIYEEASKTEKSKKLYNIKLQIHQKDLDRENSGWAAIPIGIHNRRLPMRLVDGVTAEQLWGDDEITADIILKSKRRGLDFTPSEIHLVRIKD